ncbi:MAG TPA: class I SAM-dependent methyltransferase [Ottowia sp.]|nr:class I SAM-dependent methyltransferase [Ottowia sp.]
MSAANPWDARFGGAGFFYGTAPNDFLREHVGLLSGPVLSLAEGEGRNAVFLAERGLDVLGVDGSAVGLAKAERLAAERGVRIGTLLADLGDYVPEAAHYGAVVSIFAHVPGVLRQRLCPRVVQALRPGGVLVLEGYAEAQIARDTGGPKDLDLLLTVDKLRADFAGLEPLLLRQTEREVREGQGHTGLASVVQFIGRKPR